MAFGNLFQKKNLLSCAVILVLGFVLCGAMSVSAQGSFTDSIITGDDIVVNLNPRVPGPFEEVDLTVESFIINVDASEFTWIINGAVAQQGIGLKNAKIRTGDIGQTTFIEIQIRYSQTEQVIKRIRVQPGSLDILWEAEGAYTPPFYKGKALPTSESTLKITALPFDFPQNDTYIYRWSSNSIQDEEASGYRKNVYRIKNRFFDTDFTIDVVASRRDGGFQSSERLVLQRFEPELRFLAEDPFGNRVPINNNALVINDDFVVLEVVPMFFTTDYFSRNIQISWKIDGEPYFPQASDDLRYNQIYLSPDGAGASQVEVTVFHNDNILQEASASLRVAY